MAALLGGHPYLPYPQAACREIEHHLNTLAAAFPSSFDATLSPFTHDDGRDVVLVNATVTLPGIAGNNNTEVSIWLLEAYPHVPPLVFMPLRPGSGPSETVARPNYVDASGVVTAPYLQHWQWPDSDLVGLLQSLQVQVSLHPATTVRIHDDIQLELRALQEDKDRLERELQMITSNVDLLERKLSADDVGIAEPCEVAQGSGSDDTAEDAMDALDKELRNGRLTLCQYLKATKDVARAQFLNWPVPPDLLARPQH